MTILIIFGDVEEVGNRSAKGRQWSAKGRQSVGERSAIGRRKVGNGRQILSDHIAIESTIIAEYSLIQFVHDCIPQDSCCEFFTLYMLNGMPLTYLAQIHIQKAGQTTFWVRAGDDFLLGKRTRPMLEH